MSRLFDELEQGLEEALEHAQGTARRSTKIQRRDLLPLAERTPEAIRDLRVSLGKTQDVFAKLLGVSKKTVEAWEAGTKKPSGSALRLFQVLEEDARLLERLTFRDEAG